MTDQKTIAEEALEAGRGYTINTKNVYSKKKNERNRALIQTNEREHKKLHLDLLDRVERDILDSNVLSLTRSHSMNNIKFPKRSYNQDDLVIFALPLKLRAKRTLSQADITRFDIYKFEKKYEESIWSKNTDVFYVNEREWVREIWNQWFDELITQLDGTLIENSRGKQSEEYQSDVEFVFVPFIYFHLKKALNQIKSKKSKFILFIDKLKIDSISKIKLFFKSANILN